MGKTAEEYAADVESTSTGAWEMRKAIAQAIREAVAEAYDDCIECVDNQATKIVESDEIKTKFDKALHELVADILQQVIGRLRLRKEINRLKGNENIQNGGS